MRRLYVIAITVVVAAVAVMLWSKPTISVTHKYQTASAFSWVLPFVPPHGSPKRQQLKKPVRSQRSG